jgi:hypothetical protein
VPIYRLLQNSAFLPEDIQRLADAYEQAVEELRLLDRSDQLAETVAHYIIEAAQTGEKDPGRICALAVDRLQGSKPRFS